MADEEHQPSSWRLGQISMWYETHGAGPGTISTGKGDLGGVSYGEFQLSEAKKTLSEFLNRSSFKSDFNGLTPATEEFNEKWTELSSNPDFVDAQYQFIKKSHYDLVRERLKRDGFDLSERGPAVQEALWSTAVQYRGLGVNVFKHGLEAKFGTHPDLSSVSDRDIVEAVQDYKIENVDKLFASSKSLWKGLVDRAIAEKADLVQFAETGVPIDIDARIANIHARSNRQAAPTTLKIGNHGDAVNDLQVKLGQLGYSGPGGEPLVNNDKHFGPLTRAAVQEFQGANNLPQTGQANAATLQAIDRCLQEQSQSQDAIFQIQAPIRLDSPAHPDNAMYLQVRGLVYQLDQQNGRTPDQGSDNIAAALTVAARADGLHRVDKIALSDDATKLWAGQALDSIQDHFIRYANVDTVQAFNMPMEKRGADWPQAMQQFQEHQQQEQMQQQSTQQFQQQGAPMLSR